MTLAELLATRNQGTSRFPGFSLADLLARRNEPLDAKFNPSGVGPGVSYGSLASILADFAPGIGDAKSAVDAVKEAEAGNYGMSLLDAFGALPMVGGMGAIKAFHGSPHKFDAFDMSKIGTGEGAQAYGHGLYFAESPETAKTYRADRSYVGRAMAGKPDGGEWGAEWIAKNAADVHGEKAADHLRAVLKQNSKSKNPAQLKSNEEVVKAIGLIESGGVAPQGNLYETSLEWPDPAREAADPLGPQHFLDWDKPLSEQSDSIQGSLKQLDDLKEIYTDSTGMWDIPHAAGGEEFYLALYRDEGRAQDRASQTLKALGIPGIRYLDQGSRGAGDGTYNYVVFDDKIPRIVSRNGEAVASVPEGPTLASLAPERRQAPDDSLIKDWGWRPLEDVREDVGLSSVPSYITDNYGDFMSAQHGRAKAGDLGARDLLKGYGITRSSVQRQAANIDDDLASGVIRPEGYFSEWLLSPGGKAYLDDAEVGRVNEEAIADIKHRFQKFGLSDTLANDLRWGAQNLPQVNGSLNDLVLGGVDGWRGFSKGLQGIGPSKSGFIASLLGRGDIPTLDARQLDLHTGATGKAAAKYMKRGGGKGGDQAVDRLAHRQDELGLELPDKLAPFYQHLAHHAVWDKTGNTQTTHEDLIKAMIAAGVSGVTLRALFGDTGYDYDR